jgi:hypothetical protein
VAALFSAEGASNVTPTAWKSSTPYRKSSQPASTGSGHSVLRCLNFDNGGGGKYISFFGPVWSLEEKYARHIGQHSLKFGGIYDLEGCDRDGILDWIRRCLRSDRNTN